MSIVGSGFPSGGMLTSLTTHTPGLVAARDIAATLASLFNSPLADASAGSPAYPITGRQNAVIGLRAIDSETAFNQEIQTPLFWTLGVISGLFAFASLAVVLVCSRVPPTVQRCAAYGLRFIAAWPVALMIVTVFPVRSSDAYLAAIFTLVFVIALVPSVRAIYICTAIVIAADSLFGSKLISNSCFSAYYLSGIRFYGIGNEYMGLIIGGTLLAASTLWARAWPVIVRKNFVLAVFCIAVFILVYPAFGSKAGGAITSCSVFYAAFRYLHGKRVALKHIALGVGIGIVVLGVLSMLGRAFGTERTHVDIAAHAIARGHVGYILGIAFRKVGLAARIVLHPGTLLGIAAFALLAALMKKFAMEDLLKYRRERPATAAVMMASVVGAGVALLFNDSGIIAGVMLLSCVTVTLLDDLIGAKCALWHSMSAKSA